MQSRIILHGGNSSKKSDKNERFFQEIISGSESDIVRVLCVYFARPEHRWEDSYAEDQSIFRALDTDKEIETTLAGYNLEEFVESIAQSDVIFINGGMRGHLKDILLAIGLDRFRELIEDKTLVGISAGANILAKYYYSMVAEGVREGVGLLDIKLLTHYSKDKPEQLDMLKAYKEDLRIVKLPEEEFVIVK